MPAIDLKNTRAYVLTWPNHMIAMELIAWLHHLGIAFDRLTTITFPARDLASANNHYCQLAKRAKEKFCIFADNDIRPTPAGTAPFLDCPLDVVACETDCQGHPWGSASEFHAGMWRTRKEVLLKIKPPYFGWKYNDVGKIVGCTCQMFRQKALNAGFSVGHAGFAKHVPAKF